MNYMKYRSNSNATSNLNIIFNLLAEFPALDAEFPTPNAWVVRINKRLKMKTAQTNITERSFNFQMHYLCTASNDNVKAYMLCLIASALMPKFKRGLEFRSIAQHLGGDPDLNSLTDFAQKYKWQSVCKCGRIRKWHVRPSRGTVWTCQADGCGEPLPRHSLIGEDEDTIQRKAKDKAAAFLGGDYKRFKDNPAYGCDRGCFLKPKPRGNCIRSKLCLTCGTSIRLFSLADAKRFTSAILNGTLSRLSAMQQTMSMDPDTPVAIGSVSSVTTAAVTDCLLPKIRMASSTSSSVKTFLEKWMDSSDDSSDEEDDNNDDDDDEEDELDGENNDIGEKTDTDTSDSKRNRVAASFNIVHLNEVHLDAKKVKSVHAEHKPHGSRRVQSHSKMTVTQRRAYFQRQREMWKRVEAQAAVQRREWKLRLQRKA